LFLSFSPASLFIDFLVSFCSFYFGRHNQNSRVRSAVHQLGLCISWTCSLISVTRFRSICWPRVFKAYRTPLTFPSNSKWGPLQKPILLIVCCLPKARLC
jgi:hypothetical protein